MSAKSEAVPPAEAEVMHPIVVDLGKRKGKRIKELKSGRGELMDEVSGALEEVRQSLGDAARGKQLVPVVFVYREKSKERSGMFGLPFGF